MKKLLPLSPEYLCYLHFIISRESSRRTHLVRGYIVFSAKRLENSKYQNNIGKGEKRGTRECTLHDIEFVKRKKFFQCVQNDKAEKLR